MEEPLRLSLAHTILRLDILLAIPVEYSFTKSTNSKFCSFPGNCIEKVVVHLNWLFEEREKNQKKTNDKAQHYLENFVGKCYKLLPCLLILPEGNLGPHRKEKL